MTVCVHTKTSFINFRNFKSSFVCAASVVYFVSSLEKKMTKIIQSDGD